MSFEFAPIENQKIILSYLSEIDLIRLNQTNKYFYHLTKSSKEWLLAERVRLNSEIIFYKLAEMLDQNRALISDKQQVKFVLFLNDPISVSTHTFMIMTYPKKIISLEFTPTSSTNSIIATDILNTLYVPYNFPDETSLTPQEMRSFEIVKGAFKVKVSTDLIYFSKKEQLRSLLEENLGIFSNKSITKFLFSYLFK